ncbi:lipoprotein [Pseudomonas benzenivorans]|uniref:Type IV secretion system putative lipoprotein virB7 n=1 Tax=Pseudomonas benzenivorans TaxID=556533 RepID=A0ABZ0PZ14_9PSED|nr:lipoprotein [Pseudomonas benzenivorans]WPC06462.1 lipoprotein [Pseudomonas benzenivorans]
MKRPIALALLALTLAGCATPRAADERPYSDAEIRQFSLELLSRSGLPYEDYEKIRRALLEPKPRAGRALAAPPQAQPKRG